MPSKGRSPQWKLTVSDYVTQCFQTYPQYGNDAGTLETQIKTFCVGLEDYETDEVDYAFRHWLKECPKMPVPSEIGFIASDYRKTKNRPVHPPAKQAQPRNVRAVPWVGLSWREINEKGLMPQIEKHLAELTRLHGKERAEGYLKYLKSLKEGGIRP